MKFNPIEIFNAWVTAANPTELRKTLAEARLGVCMGCEFKKEIFKNKKWSATCGKCGCPISKKIFTNEFGSCPLKKWNNVEEEYISTLNKLPKHLI